MRAEAAGAVWRVGGQKEVALRILVECLRDLGQRRQHRSLGVILYELLTGAVQFSRKELETGLAEMLHANGYLTTQLLDAMGNLTGLQDPSALHNLTTFAYDGLNRKVSMTDPLGKVGTYLYNSVGLLTETVDRLGRKIDFQYDADNRMTTQIWKDSSGNPLETFTYSYDANGNEP